MKLLLFVCFVAIYFVFVLARPSNDDQINLTSLDVSQNCSMCETVYGTVLKNVKPAEIADENAAHSYLFGECNYFRQLHAPFWQFCFELYTSHFQEVWDDLKGNVSVPVACAGLLAC
uniref:Saposin B-type domain-containing protein n=1 Tax=Panagrellus redivivus TaxID=6233 RepID=A0A7E4UP81_PANRE